MKPVAMFVLGAVLAAGLVYYVVKRDEPVAAVPAPVSAPQPAAQTPGANPEAQPPAAAPAPEAQHAAAPAPSRKPSRTPRQAPSKPAEQPVQTAQTQSVPPAPAPGATAAPPPPPASTPEPARPAVEEPKPAPREPKTVTIPAGTLLTVRIDETLASDRNQTGDTFRATLEQPLVVDGYVIAERGARVEGRIAEIDTGGRVRGLARMSLELVRLTTADGQRIRLHTETFAKEAERSRGKDAAKIGAAAGIGAAIGAIAGGGKGAAIGAAVGGAAGTGGVMATRGEPVRLPAETRLSFRLSQPVTITEKL